MRDEEIVKRWRKLKMPGRLYWKRGHWKWRTFFDGDDKAVWKDGSMSMHFKTYQAIWEFIDYNERVLSRD